MTTAPEPAGIYISTGQMYQEVRGLSETVSRIENKLDGILDTTGDLRKDVDDHETRLRGLERARWPLPTIGVLAGLGGAITGAIALVAR
ncbi:hypothetical protein AB0469_31970 [Streptomyces sp. NPDC093801]|uniref:hypothetical protein n=1 Tax=Streptomyces sp. NPDC093801 TaxID=3155203 RepID=UPI00344C6B4F